MATAQTLIDRALRLIGALESGESPSADETADALIALNQMIDSWRNDALTVYQIADVSHVLTGVASYTIGSGGDINTTRPVRIVAARLTVGSTDHPVEVITQAGYAAIGNKTTTGQPDRLYYEPSYPLGTITLYPVPTAADTLKMSVWQPIGQLATAGTSIALPPGYERALTYNLAVELAPEFQVSAPAEVVTTAGKALAAIKRTNAAARPILAQVDTFTSARVLQ